MRLLSRFIAAVLILSAVHLEAQKDKTALPQETKPEIPGPLSVCELLANATNLNRKNIAVVGRLDCLSNPTDHSSCFLAENKCDKPLTLNGHVWPSKVWLNDRGDEAPRIATEIDAKVIITKLKLIRKNTRPGQHKEWARQLRDGKIQYGWVDVADEWAIAYGRVSFAADKRSNPNCLSESGCQAYDETPVTLEINWQTLVVVGSN